MLIYKKTSTLAVRHVFDPHVMGTVAGRETAKTGESSPDDHPTNGEAEGDEDGQA
jgi:hypothetical protein